MQAIVTRWMPPTNKLSARVKARCDARSVTVGWDHALDVRENHDRAAFALLKALDWQGLWQGGSLPEKGTRDCMAYVLMRHGKRVRMWGRDWK